MMNRPIYVQKNVESMLRRLSKTKHQQAIPNKACINLKLKITYIFNSILKPNSHGTLSRVMGSDDTGRFGYPRWSSENL